MSVCFIYYFLSTKGANGPRDTRTDRSLRPPGARPHACDIHLGEGNYCYGLQRHVQGGVVCALATGVVFHTYDCLL